MNHQSIIVLLIVAASLGLYAQAEAGGFYGSISGPDVFVSFSGPPSYGYYAPYSFGFAFAPDIHWSGHHRHHHGRWHGHRDDHGRHGGRHGGGRRGHR
jgi:hypothetical protein